MKKYERNEGFALKKKFLSIICAITLSASIIIGCGDGNSLKTGRPYSIESNGAEVDITVNSATRTTLLEDFNGDTKNDIVYIDCSIKLTDPGENTFLTSYDFEGNVRVKNENGDVIDFFEYALPDDKTVVKLEENQNIDCSFPVVVPMEAKRVIVDLFDGDSFSNEITLVIK